MEPPPSKYWTRSEISSLFKLHLHDSRLPDQVAESLYDFLAQEHTITIRLGQYEKTGNLNQEKRRKIMDTVFGVPTHNEIYTMFSKYMWQIRQPMICDTDIHTDVWSVILRDLMNRAYPLFDLGWKQSLRDGIRYAKALRKARYANSWRMTNFFWGGLPFC